MDKDNNMVDINNITDGEVGTLQGAGVDLSSSDEKTEEFIDIDQAPKVDGDADLQKIGLEFTPLENRQDLSLLKEQMDKNALAEAQAQVPVEVQKVASVFKDQLPPEKKSEEVEFIPKIEQKVVPLERSEPAEEIKEASVSSPVNFEQKEIEPIAEDISDLEREFNKTVGGSTSSEKKSLDDDINSLESMLVRVREKLVVKKKEVKEELEGLKRAKEDIARDIENIKELEESEEKIQRELEKIEKIKQKVASIEEEVEGELNS